MPYTYQTQAWPNNAAARLSLLNAQAALGYRLTTVISNTAYFESASGPLSVQGMSWPSGQAARTALLNTQAAAGWRLSEVVNSTVYFDRPYVAPPPPNQPPTVSPSASPTSGTAPLTVQFTANASDPDGSIASYSWAFGDGGMDSTANPSHVYAAAGTYQATLTATDNQGATSSGSVGVSVVSAPPPPSNANWFVSPTGSDSNPGTSASSPFKTVQRAISSVLAGQVIELAAGTYIGVGGDSGLMDWYGKNGTPTAPIIVRPAAGATVIIQPAATTYRAVYFRNCSWIELHDLVIDGSNLTGEAVKCTTVTGGATDITLLHCEIRNARTMGVLTSDNLTARLTLRNCYIHNNGHDTNLDHNVYLATPGNVIDSCEISSAAAYGIHLYGSAGMDNNIFRSNYVHNNGGPGLGIFGGTGNLAYNNVIAGNGNLGIRVRSYEAISNCGLYNNTVTGNANIGILVENITPPTIANVHVRNNIAFGNAGTQIVTNGVSGTVSNNLTADPLFVAAGDYHLQSGSPAINAGTDLSAYFSADRDGIPRPQGTAWDIGAYEQ